MAFVQGGTYPGVHERENAQGLRATSRDRIVAIKDGFVRHCCSRVQGALKERRFQSTRRGAAPSLQHQGANCAEIGQMGCPLCGYPMVRPG